MKITKKHMSIITLAIAAALIVTGLLCSAVKGDPAPRDSSTADVRVSVTSGDETVIVPSSDGYTLIFSSDSNQLDGTYASELRSILAALGNTLTMKSDAMEPTPSAHEILIGNTDRQLSKDLRDACIAAVKNDSLVWGFAYRGGSFAYAASSDPAFARGFSDLKARFISNDGFKVESDLWLLVSLSRAEYEAELKAEADRLEAEKEAARQKQIDDLKAAIGSFSFSDFTDYVTLDYTVMPESSWGSPALYPTPGQHPRVNITPDVLKSVLEYIEKTDEGEFFYNALIAKASDDFDGILDAPYMHETGRIGYHNVNEKGLSIIEAKAFAYLLTGDEIYGYEAILSMKNYLKTLEIGYIYSDQCREFGRTIFCTAEVYDWCYDLLTEDDKNHFMIAVTDICASDVDPEFEGLCQSGDARMEVGYPPSGQGSVVGHGAEAQILRDYLSVAIAIFDENPSWYEYVGGRVYNDYIPFRDYYFTSGTYPQGIFTYAPHRHNSDVWSAWLLLSATGENPYSTDLRRIITSFYELQAPNGSFFGTGDGSRHQKSSGEMTRIAIIVAALYGDAGLRDVAKQYFGNTFVQTSITGNTIELSLAHHLIFGATYYEKNGSVETSDIREGVDVVLYHAYPISQVTARSEWHNENAPAIFMKIGEKSTSNHEHGDAGTFQIFYKGLYSGESGVYDKYGSVHWRYYHQATVGHNGILIFNPISADHELNGDTLTSSSNISRALYSGGQRLGFDSGDTLEAWLGNSATETGSTAGYEYGLNPDGTADYVYLAGDISKAYSAVQASYVGRSMFTLFTDDETYPMYFIVYDSITSADASLVNKFLLHTPTEPEIAEEARTVSFADGDGRLTLHALKGADKIEALGGEDRNYLINGIQCAESTTSSDGMWGRIEISNTGSTENEFFNVMYVTDADNEEKQPLDLFETESLIGTQIDDTVIVFSKSRDRNTEEISFDVKGEGLQRFFILGMLEGTWDIKVDGVAVAHRVSSADGGMISFYAPAGTVTVSPGKDIAAFNGGRIVYNAYGGIIPDDAPMTYEIGVPVKLPETISRGNDIFLGWFLSPTFEEETRVTELDPISKGSVAVYAKYKAFPVLEDFENKSFAFGEVNKTVNGIVYQGYSKTGSWYETVEDKTSGNKYLSVSRTETDMQINVSGISPSSFLGVSDTVITYEVDLAQNGDRTPMSSSFMLREQTTSQRVTLFNTTTSGTVTFGGETLFSLRSDFQKVIVTVDFANATLTAYDEWGEPISTRRFDVPSGSAASDTLEYLYNLTYTFNWWMGGGESILIDNIKVYCGTYDAPELDLPEGTHRIIYKLGSGIIRGDCPTTYTVGTPVTLPIPTAGNGVFGGWYTTPTFDEDSKITEIDATSADEPITVYAKFLTVIIDKSFTDSATDVNAATSSSDGLNYLLNGKTGSTAKAENDGAGNTYIRLFTDENDATVNYMNSSIGAVALGGGGKLTYEIDLATLKDGRIGATTFKLRTAGGTADVINIFGTNKNGQVLLNNKTANPVGTLGTEFTKFIFTLDIYAGTLTAYNVYGIELTSVSVSVPSISSAEDLAEWIGNVTYGFNWHMSAGGGIAFDNIKIYVGEYTVPDWLLPDGTNVILYQTGTGKLPEGYPQTYTVGVPTALPSLTVDGGIFLGWYTTPTFDEGTVITEINASDAEDPICLYARIHSVVFDQDFSSSTTDVSGTYGSGDGLSYAFTNKEGSTAKAVTDASGNVYLSVYTDANDASINYTHNSLSAIVKADGGRLTYELDLAALADGRVGSSSFKLRKKDGAASDSINIFSVSSDGEVCLNANYSYKLGKLDTALTKYVFTIDIYEETLTAYNVYGDVLAEIKVSSPAAGSELSVAEWFDTVGYCFNWHVTPQGGIAFDNIKIYTGDYQIPTDLFPEGTNRVLYYLGNGVLAEEPPQFYTVGTPLTLPSPTSTAENEVFAGWYTSPDFDESTRIEVINAENADGAIRVYAKYALPEGMNRIIYELGGGALPADAPKVFAAGEPLALPTPTLSGSVFAGWYTAENFDEGTKMTEINEATAEKEIILYAKFITVLLDQSFTGTAIDVDASYKSTGNLEFSFKDKTGTTATSVNDGENTYLRIYTDANDATVNNYADLSPAIKSGKITFELDIATLEDGRINNSTLSLRGAGGTKNTVALFKITSSGAVLLGGKSDLVIATLGTDFTRIAITVDIDAGTATAYSRSGAALASCSLSMPTGYEEASFAAWFAKATHCFNWWFNAGGGAAIDNLRISAGEHIPTASAE